MNELRPRWQPLTFDGYLARAVLHQDRVEITRRRIAKLGGNRDAVIRFEDVVSVTHRVPTLLVNGHVWFGTAEEPDAPPAHLAAGHPHALLFTLQQRETFDAFLESAVATWQAGR
ncbi:hypothetical protein AB0M39_36765 [Streptomyces sp. NPDC051907]|uniref:hypothetical protein n=1 Tax=Streptomyces sp. NPDC051907 TaxID=3155284 RepID=UPI003449C83C